MHVGLQCPTVSEPMYTVQLQDAQQTQYVSIRSIFVKCRQLFLSTLRNSIRSSTLCIELCNSICNWIHSGTIHIEL